MGCRVGDRGQRSRPAGFERARERSGTHPHVAFEPLGAALKLSVLGDARAEDLDLASAVGSVEGLLAHPLDLVDVLLLDALRLTAVVDVGPCQARRDGEEDGHLGSRARGSPVEDKLGDAEVDEPARVRATGSVCGAFISAAGRDSTHGLVGFTTFGGSERVEGPGTGGAGVGALGGVGPA